MQQVHHFPLEFGLVNVDQYQFIEGALDQHRVGTRHAYLAGADDRAFAWAANCRRWNCLPIGSKETIYHMRSPFLFSACVFLFERSPCRGEDFGNSFPGIGLVTCCTPHAIPFPIHATY